MSDSPFDLLAIRECFRPAYEVLQPLGRGGMAVVLRACQTSLNREVALKILDPALASAPDFRERFYREARIASRLSHPNLTTCYDFGQIGPYYYISYQLIEGENLRVMLDREGRLDQARAVCLFGVIAATLHHLHEKGVVHRDIKPENILIERETGLPFVADLGVARDPTGVPLTNAENVLGTPAFVSPEQIAGEVPGPGSDIYSLGITLYEAITGHLPFKFTTVASLIRCHLDEPPSFPPGDFDPMHPGWRPLLSRMLAKRPADRHPTGAEVAAELETLLAPAVPVRPKSRELVAPSGSRPSTSTAKRTRSLPAAIVASVVCVAWLSLRLVSGPHAAESRLPTPSVAAPALPTVTSSTPPADPGPRGPPSLLPYLEEFCATLRSHPAELRRIEPVPPGSPEQHREWRDSVLQGLYLDELGRYPGMLALLLVLDPERVESLEVRLFPAPGGTFAETVARSPGRAPVNGELTSDGSLLFRIPPAWIFPGARLLAFPESTPGGARLETELHRSERPGACEAASGTERVPDASPAYASDPVYHRAMDDQYTTDWRNALATLRELSQRFPEDPHLEAMVAELAIAGTRSTPSKLEQEGLDIVAASRDDTDYTGLVVRGVRDLMPILARHPRDPLLWVHLGTALTMGGFVPAGELCWKVGCLRGPSSYWAWHEKLQNVEDLSDILQANRSDYMRAYKLARDVHVLLPPGQLRYAQLHDHAVNELQRRANAPVTSPRTGR